MTCNFTATGRPGVWYCPACKRSTNKSRQYDKPPRRNCTKAKQRKLLTYAAAVRRWIAAGRPTRTDAETKRIYETICRPCDHFDAGGCRRCGCKLDPHAPALINKIRMKTETCPEGEW